MSRSLFLVVAVLIQHQQCNSASIVITKPLSGAVDISLPVVVDLELEGNDYASNSIVCYQTDSYHKKCTPLSAAVLEPIDGLEPGVFYTIDAYITNSEGVPQSVITHSHFKTADIEKRRVGLIQDESARLHQLGADSYWAGDLTSSSKLFKSVRFLDPLNKGSWEGAGASDFGLGLYAEATVAFLSAVDQENQVSMLRNTRAAKNWDLLYKLVEPKYEGFGTVSVVSTFFRGKGKYSELRFKEIVAAQMANLHNPDIHTLVLVADIKGDCNPVDYLGHHDKLKVIQQESSGAPSWGELYKVGGDVFNEGDLVVFSHGDMAYFHQNASLNLLPALLCADRPTNKPLPAAAGGGDLSRPIAVALTRRPHSACPWESGGGHLHEIPVDLCTGPHGAAEGTLGYDAFAMLLPLPPLLISLSDQLRTNHLGADLKMVEAMSLCDMLVVDPCVFVVGTHLHCTLERSYRADEDWVRLEDVEAGRYSVAVRPTRLTRTVHSEAKRTVMIGFHGSGDDLIRSTFEDVGSVEHDTERVYRGLDPHNCEENLRAVFVPSMKLPTVGDSHFVPLEGLRRTISFECSQVVRHAMSVPIGHLRSPVRVVLVRDPYDTIAQNFIYQRTTHRTSLLYPRRGQPSSDADLMDWISRNYLNNGEWAQYALTNANNWERFYSPIASGERISGREGCRLVVVRYSELSSERGLNALQEVLGLEKALSSQMKSTLSLGHIRHMVDTHAFLPKLRTEFASIVSPVMCSFDMQNDISCSGHPERSIPVETHDIPSLHKAFESTEGYSRLVDECNGVGTSSRCVVAFSLYGDDERYTGGVLANARDIYHCMSKQGVLGPLWHMRVYHNDSSPLQVLQALEQLGVEMVHVNSREGQLSNPRAWRFQVAADVKVHRFLLRDVDSRIGFREVSAIHAWVESGEPFHVMRDHPSHTIYANAGFLMQAGMWGGTREAVPEILSLLLGFNDSDDYIADQVFLRDKVWPLAVSRGVIQHDSFGCLSSQPPSLPFPAHGRSHEFDFVGAVVHGDGHTRPGDDRALREAQQPEACVDRPSSPPKSKSRMQYALI